MCQWYETQPFRIVSHFSQTVSGNGFLPVDTCGVGCQQRKLKCLFFACDITPTLTQRGRVSDIIPDPNNNQIQRISNCALIAQVSLEKLKKRYLLWCTAALSAMMNFYAHWISPPRRTVNEAILNQNIIY